MLLLMLRGRDSLRGLLHLMLRGHNSLRWLMRLMLLGSHDPLRLLLLPLRLLLLGSHHSSRWGMSSSNYTTWSVRLLKTCGHLVRR